MQCVHVLQVCVLVYLTNDNALIIFMVRLKHQHSAVDGPRDFTVRKHNSDQR